jgi:hypothetical protein
MPAPSLLTPVERTAVLALAVMYEMRAWNSTEDDRNYRAHALHARALRIACGETPETAQHHLLAARGKKDALWHDQLDAGTLSPLNQFNP